MVITILLSFLQPVPARQPDEQLAYLFEARRLGHVAVEARLLQLSIEVDENVPAADEPNLGEGAITRERVVGKDYVAPK